MSAGFTSKGYLDEDWCEDEVRHLYYDATKGIWDSCKLLLEDCFTQMRERLVKRHLRVIDFGSDEGPLLRFIREHFDDVDVHGLAYSDAIFNAEKMAEELGHSFNFIHGGIFGDWDTDYEDNFDIVLSFGLIEHFEQPDEVL